MMSRIESYSCFVKSTSIASPPWNRILLSLLIVLILNEIIPAIILEEEWYGGILIFSKTPNLLHTIMVKI
jgi:hypothetical protein